MIGGLEKRGLPCVLAVLPSYLPQQHPLQHVQASSMGSLLLTAGAPGHRMALPNSKIMLHQVRRVNHSYLPVVTASAVRSGTIDNARPITH